MEELDLIKLLTTDQSKAITVLISQGKEAGVLENIRKEYALNDRSIRDTQIGQVQKDKTLANQKLVKGVRIPVPFQKKIVSTAVGFEVGKPVTLVANYRDGQESTVDKLLRRMWRTNRIDAAITKLKTLQKSETQAALVFAIEAVEPSSTFQKILKAFGFGTQEHYIKAAVYESKNGNMYPYFDSVGNMMFFTWQFLSKDAEDKEIKNTWIYTKTDTIKITGDGVAPVAIKHGFDRIPIVYVSQDEPEWYDAGGLIDRYEVALSKLAASNDYSGHPMLKIFGEVQNAPDKDEDGKAWIIPIVKDDEGNEIKGDVQFLTAATAPESNKLELNTLENAIYAITSTPNLSFDNVKSIGNVSGVALKLMFLDSMIKAAANEGENRTMIDRIINIFISGMVTTTNTNLKSEAEELYYDIEFNSILPDDLKEAVDIVSAAVGAGVMSRRTGVEFLAMGDDVEKELERIAEDAAAVPEKEPVIV